MSKAKGYKPKNVLLFRPATVYDCTRLKADEKINNLFSQQQITFDDVLKDDSAALLWVSYGKEEAILLVVFLKREVMFIPMTEDYLPPKFLLQNKKEFEDAMAKILTKAAKGILC